MCVPVLLSYGYKLVFENDGLILSYNNIFVGFGRISDDFMILDIDSYAHFSYTNDSSSSYITSFGINVNIWHGRLGHIGQKQTNMLAKERF